MSNINLLPEEMRGKERKEILKAAKKPKVFEIDLSAGKKNESQPMVKPSRPSKSLWSQIFGQKIKSAPTNKMPSFGQRVEISNIAKNQNIKYQNGAVKTEFKPRTNFLSSIGPAKSPVKPSTPEKIEPAKPSFELNKKPTDIKTDYKYANEPKRKRRGFWSKFMGLFAIKPKAPRPPKPIKPSTPEKIEPAKPSFELNKKPIDLKIDFKNNISSRRKRKGFWASLKGLFAEKSKVRKPANIKSEVEAKPAPVPKPKVAEKYHTPQKEKKSILDINLIPQELLFVKYPKSRQQITSMILAIVIPALLITAGYIVIDEQQQAIEYKISKLNEDKIQLSSFISGFKDLQNKNIRLQDKLLVINKLFQKHIYWTKFFSLLERYTLDDVYYTEFAADTSGQFMLPAVATIGSGNTVEEKVADSYRKAAQQITAFEKADDFVDQIKVNNLEIVSSDKAGVKGVKFEINLSLIDNVFFDKVNNK